MLTVAVTGGTGFIGKMVIKYLLQEGFNVISHNFGVPMHYPSLVLKLKGYPFHEWANHQTNFFGSDYLADIYKLPFGSVQVTLRSRKNLAWASLSLNKLKKLKETYHIDFLIRERDMPLPLPILLTNMQYTVYDLRAEF